MCGIAGRLGPRAPGEDERMLSRLVHRGPDDQGEVGFGGGWLGHRRLSIVDVDGGHQPLGTAAGDRWLVGNGEIYNHDEVRRALGDEPYAHPLRQRGGAAAARASAAPTRSAS